MILFIRLINVDMLFYSFMFDEFFSYLDVKQRFKVVLVIRQLIYLDKFIIVVEYDLLVLDYLLDFICCFYGVFSVYGVVIMFFSVREGLCLICK